MFLDLFRNWRPNVRQPATGWNGVPPNPDQDGWHWLRKDHGWVVAFWRASPFGNTAQQCWFKIRVGGGTMTPAQVVKHGINYVGECWYPDEIENLEKQLDQARHELAQAREDVIHMQHSVWQAQAERDAAVTRADHAQKHVSEILTTVNKVSS